MPVVKLSIDSSKSVSGLKQYEKSVKNAAKTTDDSFSKMVGYAKNLAVGLAGLKIVDTIKDVALASIDSAARMQETQSKYNVVFDGMIAKTNQWASELRKDYGMSERASKEYLASTQAILLGTGMLKDESAKLSFNLVKMARDMASFNDKSPEQAINAVRSALTGEREALKQLGVVILESEVQKQAMIENNLANKNSITQAMKAQATYNLILKKASVQMGDVARNQNTYVFQLEKSKAIIEDLRTTIGSKLLPVVTKMLTQFNAWISTGNKIDKMVNGLIEGVRFLVNGFLGLEVAAKSIITVFAKAAQSLYDFASKPLRMVLDGLVAIGAIDTNPLQNFSDNMKMFTDSAVDGLTTTLDKINKVNAGFDSAKNSVKKLSQEQTNLKTQTDSAVNSLEKEVKTVVKLSVEEQKMADYRNKKAKEDATAWRERLATMKQTHISGVAGENKLKEAVKKVTQETKKSVSGLKSQVNEVKKLSTSVNVLNSSLKKTGTYKASKAWSGGKYSFSGRSYQSTLSKEELSLYKSLTPTGRGDHYFNRDSHNYGWFGGGHLHDNLDKILAEQKYAKQTIERNRKNKENGTNTSNQNNFYFNQKFSRYDVENVMNTIKSNSFRA